MAAQSSHNSLHTSISFFASPSLHNCTTSYHSTSPLQCTVRSFKQPSLQFKFILLPSCTSSISELHLFHLFLIGFLNNSHQEIPPPASVLLIYFLRGEFLGERFTLSGAQTDLRALQHSPLYTVNQNQCTKFYSLQ